MLAIVIPFTRSLDEIGFTYKIPEKMEKDIKVGQFVLVPFGKQKIEGIIIKIGVETNIKIEKIKDIEKIIDDYIYLYKYQISLINYIGENYFSLAHNNINIFFNTFLKKKIIENKLKLDSNKLEYNFNHNKNLTSCQNNAFNKINNSEENKFLLYGVTGSGKTEIYIKLIKENLDNGKQSLLLVPEIILINQLSNRIKKVFGEDVLVLNSSVSLGKKTKARTNIYNGEAKIIIGTRSTLFYPYKNLGLIIIDEEHDNSYISDNSPKYNSIDIANKITDLLKIKLVLGSGTPRINTMYNSLKGKYELINLFTEYK